MRSSSRVLATSASAVCLAFSAWRILFQGVLEAASFDAPHLDAGAGDNGLLVQLLLTLTAFVACAVWCFIEQKWTIKSFAFVLGFFALGLFFFTAKGLQRFAPGFSESVFSEFESLHNSGVSLQASDIVAKLGDPLMTDRPDRRDDGQIRWLYSYMPSCGFGWDKKYVWVDLSGHVTHIYTLQEP